MKKNIRYVVFKIENRKRIVIDTDIPEGPKNTTWQDFQAVLPENEPRYALVDVEYETEDGRPQDKLTFVVWSPDDKCGVKDKMIYASSKDAIKKVFPGIM